MNYNLFGEVYDLSISPDRIAIGNYLCTLINGEAEKIIEVAKFGDSFNSPLFEFKHNSDPAAF